MAVTIDEISALTEKLYLKVIGDNVFNSNPLLARMHARGMREEGGTAIHAPLMYAQVGASGAIRGFEPMTTDADDQFTAVDFGWKEYYAAIIVSRREMIINNGLPAKLKHLEAKSQAAEMTIRNLLGTGLQSDGVSNTRLIEGLLSVLSTTNTYPTTAAGDGTLGIDSAVETWWQAGFVGTATQAGGAPLGADGSNAARVLQGLAGNVSEAPFGPTIYLTTQDGYNRIHLGITTIGTTGGQYTSGQSFTDPDLASLGFEAILFRGVPIVVDSHVAAAQIQALNENFLDLVSHEEENFRFAPFREPTNQKAMIGYIFWTGNLVCNNRRFQGLINSFA